MLSERHTNGRTPVVSKLNEELAGVELHLSRSPIACPAENIADEVAAQP